MEHKSSFTLGKTQEKEATAIQVGKRKLLEILMNS